MFIRQTALAEALIQAAVKSGDLDNKVDHQHWIARRVAHNAIERPHMSEVREYDKRPNATQKNAGIRVMLEPGEESYVD